MVPTNFDFILLIFRENFPCTVLELIKSFNNINLFIIRLLHTTYKHSGNNYLPFAMKRKLNLQMFPLVVTSGIRLIQQNFFD